MSFRSGSVSYTRFRPTGPAPDPGSDALWESFRRSKISPEGAGQSGEPAIGWIGGRHILDLTFGWETNSFGGSVTAAMRRDVARVPADLRHAYRALAEDAYRATLPSEQRGRTMSRRERVECKSIADRQGMDEIARGHHRTMRQIPILWDVPAAMLYAPIGSDEARSQLARLFKESFGSILNPVAAGVLAADAQAGGRRAVDDLAPACFGVTPVDPGQPTPRPAWCAGDRGDMLGNEFLIWLWWHAESAESLDLDGQAITILPEKVLDLACAWDTTGTTSIRTEYPTRLRETRRALASGKWPRRMGITMDIGGDAYRATIRGETLAVSGLSLPRDEDAGPTEREAMEQRIDRILTFERTLKGLFEQFVRTRLSPDWNAAERAISTWLHGTSAHGSVTSTADRLVQPA